ncbi:SDR family NAD(P)-dependent oxidoreductase [Neptunicoccus cionae]|uniref:Short-chain dehydrogenase/reductase n=1 Tax=Neptunicoccus cionae TaxID=2035344 RepID=A0A916VS04_9RHOB|nr:SDR family NAD(P)-dependent oxidoreductase [Amylibacter cionae]GGA28299.1 short-chain dehydrogenase/reductase [Amylibacter cionae]
MKTAVITGGAGGLGQAMTADLVGQGWQVYLLDLPSDQLEMMAQKDGVTALACDLCDSAALDAAAAQILAQSPAIDLVVYNAGLTQIGPFETQDMAAHRKLFEVNYFAAVSCAGLFLQAVRQATGTHLAMSSVAGFAPLTQRTAYAASKHALEGFFKSLRSEERAHGVKVQIAAPSFVGTNIGRADSQSGGLARPGSATDAVDVMTPEDASAEILRGLSKGADMIPVGRVAKLAWWLNRLAPRRYQALMERNIGG